MAIVTNPDGTVSEFKIGQDESEPELLPTNLVSDTVKLVTEAKPAKRKPGKAKQFHYERKILGAMVKKEFVDELLAEFGNPTNAVNAVVAFYREHKKGNV